MTLRRAVVYITLMLVPMGLWVYIDGVRNDTVALSRFVVKQIAKGDESSQPRFFTRFHFPEGYQDPEEFVTLWNLLSDCDPQTAKYGERGSLLCVDGKTRPHKQVILKGRTDEGERLTVRLEWIKYRGGWYIHGYTSHLPPSNFLPPVRGL